MLESGDIIQFRAQLWLVRKIDQDTQTAFIFSQQGAETGVLGTEDDCTVICNPTKSWPFASIPAKFRGPLVSLARPSFRKGDTQLKHLIDWAIMGEHTNGGGVVFLNPTLRIAYPERLLGLSMKASVSIEIPKNFLPVVQKTPPITPKGPPTLYDHLMDDDDES
jgi:hypothetical protein